MILSNEILSEYVEIIGQKANSVVASNIAEMLLNLNNVRKVDVYFEWKLIEQDADDNKFVDAAIAGGADFIVTNDAHFNILKFIDFPKVNIISISEFLNNLQSQPLT